MDVSLLSLRRLLRFRRRPRSDVEVPLGGAVYRRDDEGAWRDAAGARADLSTCFALAERERVLRPAEELSGRK